MMSRCYILKSTFWLKTSVVYQLLSSFYIPVYEFINKTYMQPPDVPPYLVVCKLHMCTLTLEQC